MADLQKYKKNEKNKEKSAKHRAFVIICLVTNALNGVKTRLQIAAKGFCCKGQNENSKRDKRDETIVK